MLLNSRRKEFLAYAILNYADKAIGFLYPFLIFRINKGIYSDIEYIISLGLIFSSFSDLGIRQYAFYKYRIASDKNNVCDVIDVSTYPILTAYAILGILLYILTDCSALLFYGIIRGLFNTFLNIQSSVFRLRDKPVGIIIIGLLFNSFTVVFLLVINALNLEFTVLLFLLPYILFIVYCIYRAMQGIVVLKENLLTVVSLVKESVSYSFSAMLVLVMSSVENNIVKIYGYNNMEADQFQYLALLLRCFSIVLLAHTSVVSFRSKFIYTSEGGIIKREFIIQLSVVLFSYLGMLFLIMISNRFNILNVKILFDQVFIVISLTYMFMMLRAYIEQYFGKFAKLKYSLLSMSSSFAVCMCSLFLYNYIGTNSVLHLLYILLFTECINFVLTVLLYKYKIVKLCQS